MWLLCGCLSAILLQYYTPRTGHDSGGYLSYSDRIMAEGALVLEAHYGWYVGYVLFITAARSLWDNHLMIVLLQLLCYTLGTWAMYYASYSLFKDRWAAWAAAGLFMLWPDVLYWNYVVMTESLTASLTGGILGLLALYAKRKFTLIWLLPAILVLFWVRPTGVAALVAFAAAWVSTLKVPVAPTRLMVLAGILLIPCFYLLLNEMLATFVLVENYATGEVVYRATSLPDHYPGKDQLLVEVPTDLVLPEANGRPLDKLLAFIVHNPGYFSKLSMAKLFYFLTHTKPYYSWQHNLLLLLVLLPLYLGMVKTLLSEVLPHPYRIFSGVLVFMHCIIILLTIEDWDGRFLMPLLPVVFLLGSRELIKVLRQCLYWWRVCIRAGISVVK